MTTTLSDTIAPQVAPVISVEFINDTYVSLRWTAAVDNGPYLSYEVWVDGQPYASTGPNRSVTVEGLDPQTTYTFEVLASDLGANLSPFSDPVAVTTAAPNSVDTTPPTAPKDFELLDLGCGEVLLFWTQSTDDFDDPSLIQYDILVDGNLEHSVVGVDSISFFVQPTWLTVFDIYAVDTSGNQSRNATLDANLDGCP
jgi:chitin-binding protein